MIPEGPGEIGWPAELVDVIASRCDVLEGVLRDTPERIGDERTRAACRRMLWHSRQLVGLMSGRGNPVDRAMVDFAGHCAKQVIAHCGGNEAAAVNFLIGAARFAMRMGLTTEDLVADEVAHDST